MATQQATECEQPDKKETVILDDLTITEWTDMWKGGNPDFHITDVNRFLMKYMDRLLAGREHIKIFVPFCGKSVDLKWLADLGHTVVGVEFIEMGVKMFFEEQKIQFSVHPAPGVKGTLYKSEDGKIRIYCCDLYEFNSDAEGQFDAIWDRGSLNAVNTKDRDRYGALMKTLMAPGCRYLLTTMDFDEGLCGGPTKDEDIRKTLYFCDVEDLEYTDVLEEYTKGHKHGEDKEHEFSSGMTWMNERVQFLTLKQ